MYKIKYSTNPGRLKMFIFFIVLELRSCIIHSYLIFTDEEIAIQDRVLGMSTPEITTSF